MVEGRFQQPVHVNGPLNVNFQCCPVRFQQRPPDQACCNCPDPEQGPYEMCASKKKSLTVLTFELHVLHSALGQRVEGVPREVGGRVKHVGLPLLQDVLQQLVQDVTCGDAKVRGHHNGNAAPPRRVFHLHKIGNLSLASFKESGSHSSSSNAFQAAGGLCNNGRDAEEADFTSSDE